MKNLVCFLEKQSAKVLLENIFSRILPNDIKCHYVVFEGKQDLEKQLLKRINGWQAPNSAFLIMRDQDSADCKVIKNRLLELCKQSNKANFLVRIACRELESFYFGDLEAVGKGLEIEGIASHRRKAKYRDSDVIENPFTELE